MTPQNSTLCPRYLIISWVIHIYYIVFQSCLYSGLCWFYSGIFWLHSGTCLLYSGIYCVRGFWSCLMICNKVWETERKNQANRRGAVSCHYCDRTEIYRSDCVRRTHARKLIISFHIVWYLRTVMTQSNYKVSQVRYQVNTRAGTGCEVPMFSYFLTNYIFYYFWKNSKKSYFQEISGIHVIMCN